MTNEKSTAKTKDEMRWAMVRPELEAVLEEMWLARVLPLDFGAALERLRLWREMSQEELARDVAGGAGAGCGVSGAHDPAAGKR